MEDLRARVKGPFGDSIATKSNASPLTKESSLVIAFGVASVFFDLPRADATRVSGLGFTGRPLPRFSSKTGATKTAVEALLDALAAVAKTGGFAVGAKDLLLVAIFTTLIWIMNRYRNDLYGKKMKNFKNLKSRCARLCFCFEFEQNNRQKFEFEYDALAVKKSSQLLTQIS